MILCNRGSSAKLLRPIPNINVPYGAGMQIFCCQE